MRVISHISSVTDRDAPNRNIPVVKICMETWWWGFCKSTILGNMAVSLKSMMLWMIIGCIGISMVLVTLRKHARSTQTSARMWKASDLRSLNLYQGPPRLSLEQVVHEDEVP